MKVRFFKSLNLVFLINKFQFHLNFNLIKISYLKLHENVTTLFTVNPDTVNPEKTEFSRFPLAHSHPVQL